MTSYHPVTPRIAEELEKIVGKSFITYGDPEKLESYSHDEVAEKEYAHMPEVLVRPISAEEIAAVMKLANREKIPVTPRGAGSGLSGGAVPIYGGIVLSMDRMNRILEIDRWHAESIAQPGLGQPIHEELALGGAGEEVHREGSARRALGIVPGADRPHQGRNIAGDADVLERDDAGHVPENLPGVELHEGQHAALQAHDRVGVPFRGGWQVKLDIAAAVLLALDDRHPGANRELTAADAGHGEGSQRDQRKTAS